jgi:hypothetical protein
MMISPSSTIRGARIAETARTSSGKYRPSGWPLFDWSTTVAPSLNARQRNPSHFGSYSQSPASGISPTSSASIGGKGGRIGSESRGKRLPERLRGHRARVEVPLAARRFSSHAIGSLLQ